MVQATQCKKCAVPVLNVDGSLNGLEASYTFSTLRWQTVLHVNSTNGAIVDNATFNAVAKSCFFAGVANTTSAFGYQLRPRGTTHEVASLKLRRTGWPWAVARPGPTGPYVLALEHTVPQSGVCCVSVS